MQITSDRSPSRKPWRVRSPRPSSAANQLAVLFVLACCRPAYADRCSPSAGRITSIQGAVEIRGGTEDTWHRPALKDVLCAGDILRVRGLGRAAVLLDNEITLRLDRDTTLTIADIAPGKQTVLDMLKGALHVITRSPSKVKVITPYLNGAVEGTEFYVASGDTEGRVGVIESRVVVSNAAGSVTLGPGDTASAAAGTPPVGSTTVKPSDAVQWTLHVVDVVDAKRLRQGLKDGPVARALEELRSADSADTLKSLEFEPADALDAHALVARAAVLLKYGRLDRAGRDIDQALALDPKDADAYSLRAAAAIAHNDKTQALDDARRAVALAPDRASALLALSYARQASYDVPAARAAAERAVKAEPDNALAWTRLAEMRLASGDIRRAIDAGRRASDLDPGLGRAQAALGFAQLARYDTTLAAAAFDKAIALDSTDPLPRLGLGLAYIKDGKLDAGRAEIEIAVSLDPGNSILRTYVGKAYYEEKRDKLAGTQYGLARERDPLDPTPWFYDGLLAQSNNRPVDALTDIDKSTDLNDERVPYRTRLLLDRDLSDRGAGLARIYSELGFDRLAFVEGAEAENLDPTSAQAHRFLADASLGQSRGSIASASELLQSRLLETGHVEPIQPSLGDDRTLGSGLSQKVGILRALGPSQAGFNEYNPLYKRDGLSGSVDVFAGDRGTIGDQVVATGGLGRGSFSVGHQYFESHGLVDQSHQRGEILDGIAQVHLTSDTTLQVEARNLTGRRDQVVFAFDPANAIPSSLDENSNNLRVGLRQRIDADSSLLVSGAYETRHLVTLTGDGGFDDTRLRLSSAEIQYTRQLGPLRIALGATNLQQAQDDSQGITGVFFQEFQASYRQESAYAYGRYSTWNGRLALDAGVSATLLKNDDLPLRKITPKFGLTLKPLRKTTVRLAMIESVRRPTPANETIEPTQVAGFNQLFDDPVNATFRRLGAAIDQEFGRGVFGGVEAGQRKIVTHALFDPKPDFEWRERTGHAYLDWAVPREVSERLGTTWQFAAGIDYDYEHVVRNFYPTDPSLPITLFEPDGIYRLTNRIVPIRFGAFSPTGWSLSIVASKVNQSAALVNQGTLAEFDPTISVWVTDVTARYRLPKRLGFLSFGVSNLFDHTANIQELDPANPRFAPKRLMFGRATLVF